MHPLLTYALSTTPSTLKAGQQNAILTFVATNTTANSVAVAGISITIPVGDSAIALTNTPTSISQIPSNQWTINPPNNSSHRSTTLIFVPSGEKGTTYTIPARSSLVFVLTNIQVNNISGPVLFTITEGSSGNPTQPITLSKFPAGWGNVNFSVEPTNINAGSSVMLTWDGPNGATYSIQYADDAGQIINIPAPGHPPLGNTGTYPVQGQPSLILNQTTTFTLTVSETIDGKVYKVTPQQTVTVIPAAPQIISFTGESDYTQTPPVLNLTWQTTGADYVKGSWTSDTQNPNATALIQPPFAPSYTITAIDINGAESQPETISIPEIISLTAQIDDNQNPPVLNLTWQTTGADYVQGSWTADSLSANPATPEVIQQPFAASYTINAISKNGPTSQPETVVIPEITNFTAQVRPGGFPNPLVILIWQTTGAEYVQGSWTANRLPPNSSSIDDSPPSSTYTIFAVSATGVKSLPSTTQVLL